jgi:hypothetical protein
MKNYKLHYKALNSQVYVHLYEFKKFEDLEHFVYEKCRENRDKAVYLISKDCTSTSPFITDNPFDIEFILLKMPQMNSHKDTFIYEYDSFESAYKSALDIVEPKKLCYSK